MKYFPLAFIIDINYLKKVIKQISSKLGFDQEKPLMFVL